MQTLAVLNPLRETDAAILQDTDLAGPLAFVLAFGAFLLLVSQFCSFQFQSDRHQYLITAGP